MNHFKHLDTKLVKSEFDFTKVKKDAQFTGECELSTALGIPKNPASTPNVQCVIELNIGSKDDLISIYVKSVSLFALQGKVEPDSLREDAESFCMKQAFEELSEKVKELTLLHTGTPLTIPIPDITP